MTLATLERALTEIQETVRELEPARVTTADAVRLFGLYSALERTVVAGKTLVAARATESNQWKDEGHRSPASWVAATTGTGFGESIGIIETAEQLQSLPETTEALRRGELSAPQLRAIASTAATNPDSEKELLEAASTGSLKGLKDACLRVKARTLSETESRARYEEIRKNRSLVMWTDANGVGRVDARLTPDALGRFASAIQHEANAIFGEARKSGHHEAPAAYAADALVALVTGTGAGTTPSAGSARADTDTGTGKTKRRQAAPRPTTTMHLRVDLAALRRGSLKGGELCEIPGVGPVPLATAVNEMGEAILRVVISDGVDVTTVCHLGRAVPAHIRSALEDRDRSCVVPGCDVAKGLEIDHYQVAFENDGPTELWNLARLCHWHHYLKTHCDYAITGGPGAWEWHGPSSDRSPVLRS